MGFRGVAGQMLAINKRNVGLCFYKIRRKIPPNLRQKCPFWTVLIRSRTLSSREVRKKKDLLVFIKVAAYLFHTCRRREYFIAVLREPVNVLADEEEREFTGRETGGLKDGADHRGKGKPWSDLISPALRGRTLAPVSDPPR